MAFKPNLKALKMPGASSNPALALDDIDLGSDPMEEGSPEEELGESPEEAMGELDDVGGNEELMGFTDEDLLKELTSRAGKKAKPSAGPGPDGP